MSPHISWLDELKRAWQDIRVDVGDNESRRSKHGSPKARARWDFLEASVRKEVQTRGLPEVVRAFKSYVQAGSDTTDFTYGLGMLMVIIPIETGDRRSLVEVLAAYCPERIYLHNYIEMYLVMHGSRSLQDPMLVLFEAYDVSGNSGVKHSIAEAMRRAFPQVVSEDEGDAASMEKCRTWYMQHREHLSVNNDYVHKALNPAFEGTSLFVISSKREYPE